VTRKALIGPGLLLALAAPAHAECFNCYDKLAWVAIAVAVLLVAVVVAIWWLLRAGKAWILGWLIGAVVVYGVGAWAVSRGWQTWSRWQMERHEISVDLPLMSSRTPLLIYGGTFSGRYTMGCDGWVHAFRETQGPRGFLAVQADVSDALAVAGPIALADLPLEFQKVVPADPAAPKPLSQAETAADNGRYSMRLLSADERKAAASRIDYVVIAPCGSAPGLEAQLRQNPALAGVGADVEITLAMAAIAPGSGTVVLKDLKPDLLDLTWEHLSLGFPPHVAIGVWSPNATVGAEALRRSFCTNPDGRLSSAC
jgi:hypothetical protein